MTVKSALVRRRFWPLLVTMVAVVAAILAAAAGTASAQDWPSKPVRILVPYAAGGNSDSMARITAQRFAETFGQQFVVENRIGANGAIAADAVARAAPDGATLLWGVQPALTIAPAMNKVNFDRRKTSRRSAWSGPTHSCWS
jgi:tripartite-type tricarboxylate transporter receptor subunit TctC